MAVKLLKLNYTFRKVLSDVRHFNAAAAVFSEFHVQNKYQIKARAYTKIRNKYG